MWPSLIQTHSDPRNLADQVDVRLIFIDLRTAPRGRVRNHNQLLPSQARPAACKTLPMLEKIDRAFKFIVPTGARNLTLRAVDGNKSPWQQQSIHEPIV